MASLLVELRPNRHLLEHDFEGYKLNLQSVPQYVHELTIPVDRLYPDEVQYSFVHAKLFALHNHLVLDYWNYSFNYYYIDTKQQIRYITFENMNRTFQNTVVYDIPAHVERKSGHFNLCLLFPSSTLAVISDGTGYLHIVNTMNRNGTYSKNHWQTLYSNLILGEGKYFILIDCRMQEKDSTEILHCLLQSVEQNEKHFNSILTWVSFENDGRGWKQGFVKQIQGKGVIHYAAIETSCNALYIASDNPFKFTSDSVKEIDDTPKETPRKIIYTWLQTSEDVTVTLKLQPNFNKKLLNVSVTPLAVKVSYAGKKFIDGKLTHKVDSELTTWNVQDDGQVDILLTKAESMMWADLIEGGDLNGEQVMDASLVEEAHRRLQHLCSETEVSANESVPGLSTQDLEECDAASEEDTVLVRLEASNHETTHRIPLSVHQHLFTLRLEIQEAPALALRHDVDAIVWQPCAPIMSTEPWPIKHQGTLSAFGYVQSSKQNRKFVTCSPNFLYSVVCEGSKHLFIYKNVGNKDCQLRKRTGNVMKNVKVGQQHVVNVDKYGEVVGINATNEFLFILTEKSLVAIEID